VATAPWKDKAAPNPVIGVDAFQQREDLERRGGRAGLAQLEDAAYDGVEIALQRFLNVLRLLIECRW
jgi:hypothetical protein